MAPSSSGRKAVSQAVKTGSISVGVNMFDSDRNVIGAFAKVMRTMADLLKDQKEERIRTLAYQLWEDAGCPDNRSDEFWLQAEDEILGVITHEN